MTLPDDMRTAADTLDKVNERLSKDILVWTPALLRNKAILFEQEERNKAILNDLTLILRDSDCAWPRSAAEKIMQRFDVKGKPF